jgi:hypothetical protein
MQVMAQLLAVLCCAVFCGAAIYINVVEHPARMACGTLVAITAFAPSYRRAAVMQAVLAACGLLFAVLAWLSGAGLSWLMGGILLGLVIPYTLVVIRPTNKRLLAPGLDQSSEEAQALLRRWGRLHAVRSVLSFLALVVFLLIV